MFQNDFELRCTNSSTYMKYRSYLRTYNYLPLPAALRLWRAGKTFLLDRACHGEPALSVRLRDDVFGREAPSLLRLPCHKRPQPVFVFFAFFGNNYF